MHHIMFSYVFKICKYASAFGYKTLKTRNKILDGDTFSSHSVVTEILGKDKPPENSVDIEVYFHSS